METKTPVYEMLVGNGIEEKVAEELDAIHQAGMLADGDLDERAIDAIKEFSVENALAVLNEFKNSNLEHVSNKSAFLCGVMKTYRQKNKMGASSESSASANKRVGPDETKIKAILDRTGYGLDVTTGQRKYGGPPPGWDGGQPGPGHEVFCGRIPKDIYEDELIPHFEKCGPIWDLRLMMDPLTGNNRGFCFVTFIERDGAQEGVKRLNGFEIRPGKYLKVNISVANVRLFVGNIPKNKSKEDILDEFKKHTDGLVDVIIYSSPDDPKKKNRGFAFLEYDSHKSASMAKHRIGSGWTRVWGCDIIVDWADPLEEPDEETMSKVKVLYVRNLKSDVTDDQLRERFEAFGKVERVKKVKDYGFVHFETREHALKAMEELNGTKIGDSDMQISLAKPPTENKQKEKRKQQYKMPFSHAIGRGGGGGYDDFYLPPYVPGAHMMMPSPVRGSGSGGGGGGGPRMNRLPVSGRGGGYRASADYEYDYHGYKDFRSGSYTDDYDYYYCEPEDYHYYGSNYAAEPMPRGRGGRGSHAPPYRGYSHYWQPVTSTYPSWSGRGTPGSHWGARR